MVHIGECIRQQVKEQGKSTVWLARELGWQIGIKGRINNNFLVGLSYGKDFGNIAKKVNISTAAITLGYCF